jgi:hypothetical protein
LVTSTIGGWSDIKACWRPVENPPEHPTGEDRHVHRAAILDEAELARLARLVAQLTPAQQRLLVALADGFRGGWLEPVQWERAWRGLRRTGPECGVGLVRAFAEQGQSGTGEEFP